MLARCLMARPFYILHKKNKANPDLRDDLAIIRRQLPEYLRVKTRWQLCQLGPSSSSAAIWDPVHEFDPVAVRVLAQHCQLKSFP